MGKIREKSMDRVIIKAAVRDAKIAAAKLRKSGALPAVVYGHNVENQNLSVDANEFEKVFRKAGESTIIDLAIDGGKTLPVLIHDVQHQAVTSRPEHVDFFAVNMSEKLTATVALEFTGESPAVKAMGGTLVKVLSEVEVECLPADLPHNIAVSIDSLKTFEDVIFAKNIQIPAKVTLVSDPEEVVAKVQPPRDVEAELAAPVVEDVSAVQGAAEDKPAAVAEGEGVKKE